MNNLDEIWYDIKEYESFYKISNLGRVLSLRTNKIMIPKNNFGYNQITLFKDSKRKTFSIHRLVADHFLENTFNKPYVNHINGLKNDNSILNLEYVTQSENTLHSYKIGILLKNKQNDDIIYYNTLNEIKNIYGDVEFFKDVIYNNIDFTGLYKISNKGIIISLHKKGKGLLSNNKLKITLSKNGKKYHCNKSLLLQMLFISNTTAEINNNLSLKMKHGNFIH